MRGHALIVWMFLGAGLAGCSDVGGDSTGGAVATEETIRGTDQGILEGLLVDDRFRPLELVAGGDDATTEFRRTGFILLQETGDQLYSNGNGEFLTPALPPGRYTLRFEVDGHEATPVQFEIAPGKVSETHVVARRVATSTEVVVTQEFAVFIPCMVGLVATPFGACALMDASGDTARYVFRMNISAFPDVTFLVNELLLNKDAGSLRDGSYMMQIEGPNPENPVQSYNYVVKYIDEGAYDKVVLERGVNHETQEDPLLSYGVWESTDWIGWRFWGRGLLATELNGAGAPVGYGVGPQLGMKASVLTSLFFTDDRAEVESYCAYCGA